MVKGKASGLGVTSLILGIIAIVLMALFFIPFSSLVGFILSILAIIFGAIAFWGSNKDKFGLAGFILGIIAISLVIVVSALTYFYVSGFVSTPPLETVPSIGFIADTDEYTLTVTYTDQYVIWDDLNIIGSYDSKPSGVVNAGDKITGCNGEISIVHMPTNAMLFMYDFE